MTGNLDNMLTGRVIKLGDHVDTDLIYPARYVPLVDPKQWALHALEGVSDQFPQRINPGNIIVAGRNFGCGSARSQAVSCLKMAGIAAIVAGSFGRIFFRNSINQGMPVIQCAQAAKALHDGQKISIDLTGGSLSAQDLDLKFNPLPGFLLDILGADGLLNHTKRMLDAAKAEY